jgi:hypothetical protein
MLTEEHKSKTLAASLESLCCYQDKDELFVESIVTGDETGFTITSQSKKETQLQKNTVMPYSAILPLGREHYHEGMFKLVKQWDKCPNANGGM